MQETGRARLAEVGAVFGRLGWVAFGGPASHVALMEREIVRRRGWLGDEEFAALFAACNLVPGPASTQLALLLGRRRAGWAGMLVAAVLFIGPAVGCMLLLGELYVHVAGRRLVDGALHGVDAAVVAILLRALVDLSRLGLRRPVPVLLACCAAVCGVAGVPPVPVLLGAGLVALVAGGGGIGLRGVMLAVGSGGPVMGSLGLAFLKIGALAFGSGYVLLPLLHSELVAGGRFGLTDHQVADAFGVAQATPGPVFATAAFLGVQVAGVPGGLVAALAVFAPSAVYVNVAGAVAAAVRTRPSVRAALQGVLAAAVGLIAASAWVLARGALTGWGEVAGAVAALALLAVRPAAQPLAVGLGAVAGLLAAVASG